MCMNQCFTLDVLSDQDIPFNIDTPQNNHHYMFILSTLPLVIFFLNEDYGSPPITNIGTLNGVIVSWSTNVQTLIVADSTDTGLKLIFSTVKIITSLCHFLASCSIHYLISQPIAIYADNHADINIIEENKIPNQS